MTVVYDDPNVSYDASDVVYGGYSELPGAPVATIEVDFDNDPGSATRSWTDITPWFREFSTSRGRQHELDRVEAGLADIIVDNRDQRFDPANTSGPYYGGLRPMRRIRISATWDGVRYPLFTGLVESWPQQYAGGSDGDAFVALRCVDLFKSLNLIRLDSSYSQQLSGERVDVVLDDVGWPADDRDVDIGQSTVQNVTLDGAALDHLQKVAESENGLLYISKAGDVRFIERHALIRSELNTATQTWGDLSGENAYRDITLEYGDATIWNEVEVSSQGVATQTAEDTTSHRRYFRRTLSRTGLLLTSTTEQQAAAEWLLSRFSEPAIRATSMMVSGQGRPSLWPAILSPDLGEKVRVRRRPPGDGDMIEVDSFIESISHRVDRNGRWEAVWRLSPITGFSDYWILEDPVQGVLGTSTRLAY